MTSHYCANLPGKELPTAKSSSMFFCVVPISRCQAIITVSLRCKVIKVQSRGISSALVIVFSCLLCLSLFLNSKITTCSESRTCTRGRGRAQMHALDQVVHVLIYSIEATAEAWDDC